MRQCHDQKNISKADILAKVTLYPTAQGGRESATPSDKFGCLCVVNGVHFDCRLLLAGIGALRPGQSVTVPIKFLDADTAKNFIGVGTRFFLREVKIIGEGEVEKLLFN